MGIYFFLMLLLMLLSLFFLVIVILFKEFYLLYALYMVISYLVVRYLYNNKVNAYQGIPIYMYLFMPGLGSILLILILSSLYYFKRSSFLIEDYETYIRFRNQLDREKTFNYEESITTMSGLDLMKHLNAEAKKEVIIEKMGSQLGNNIKVLKTANIDKNSEVQHYASVMLNEIENNINNKIYRLKEKYKESSSLKTLDELIKHYKEYIASDLLEENVLSVYNNEYIRLLNERLEMAKFEKSHYIELMNAYIRNMDYIKSREVFREGIKLFPKTVELYLLKLKVDLILNHHEAVRTDIKYLKEIDKETVKSEQLKSQLEFWCQEPIERKI